MSPKAFLLQECKNVSALLNQTLRHEYGMDGSQDFFKLAQAVRVAAQANQKYLCTTDRTTTPTATPNTLTCVRHPTGKS